MDLFEGSAPNQCCNTQCNAGNLWAMLLKALTEAFSLSRINTIAFQKFFRRAITKAGLHQEFSSQLGRPRA